MDLFPQPSDLAIEDGVTRLNPAAAPFVPGVNGTPTPSLGWSGSTLSNETSSLSRTPPNATFVEEPIVWSPHPFGSPEEFEPDEELAVLLDLETWTEHYPRTR
jgi:hypothetical protein